MKMIAKGLLFSAAALALAGCSKTEEAAPVEAATETAAATEAATDAAATDAATAAASDAATAAATEGLDDTNNPVGPGKQ